jgi:hypothetical protein
MLEAKCCYTTLKQTREELLEILRGGVPKASGPLEFPCCEYSVVRVCKEFIEILAAILPRLPNASRKEIVEPLCAKNAVFQRLTTFL